MQRTRMFKTLGCLVLAMTVTGVALSWLQPSAGFVSEASAVQTVLDRARTAVIASNLKYRASWRGVEIVAGAATHSTGPMLAAHTKAEDCHFSVDDAGSANSLEPRPASSDGSGRQGIVRIRVLQSGLEEPMTPTQWLSVRSLIAALNSSVSHAGSSLPIRLDADWARVYGVSETAVFELASNDLPG